MNKEKLNEAPTQFTIPRDLLNDPDRLDVGEIARKANADAQEAERLANLEAKAKEVLDKIESDDRYNSPDPNDVLEVIFENTVPDTGKADTVAGEIARAMMRIVYRDYNDGDVFFSGYGLETCAPSAAYLATVDPSLEEAVLEIMENAKEYDYDMESDYEIDVRTLTSIVVDFLKNNKHLFGTENTEDSLEVDIDFIKDNMPTYDYEPDISGENLDILLEKDILSHSDVYQAVDDIADSLCSSRYNIEEIYRNSYVITNIDAEDLGRLEEEFENEFNDWVQNEYDNAYEQGLLDEDEDDFDDEDNDDEVDESLDDFDPDDIRDFEEEENLEW